MSVGVEIVGDLTPAFTETLTPEAVTFIARLERAFRARRRELLAQRVARQQAIDAGQMPDFLPDSADIRDRDWTVAPIPPDLMDRRVEITGPVDRKMVINALNSGAGVFMADFEDAHSPTWEGTLQGQINLRDAIRGTISYINPANNKLYQLNEKTATLMVRPRGWHLDERHVQVDGQPMSGSLFDFGLYFFHNAKTLINKGAGPYFYLPKLENHLEARLWNDVFILAQEMLAIPLGTIRATVLIENILAAFEMDEILWELREHSAGLNCGRWDYIFSAIRKFRNHPQYVFPDRAQVTMTRHMLRSYSLLLIKTCHRRGIHAMGGMAAQIPIKNDPVANEIALEKVRADKVREARDGHDGTWVAHPGLVPLAREVFDEYMPSLNQIQRQLPDVHITAADLLEVPTGTVTLEGFLLNMDVGLQYLESWLSGVGCVPIYNLMEDAATAEISRSQLWQWLHNPQVHLEDGRGLTPELYRAFLPVALERVKAAVGPERFTTGRFAEAVALLDSLVLSDQFTDFLTLPAYQYLN